MFIIEWIDVSITEGIGQVLLRKNDISFDRLPCVVAVCVRFVVKIDKPD